MMRRAKRDGLYCAVAEVFTPGFAGAAVCGAKRPSVVLDNGVEDPGHLAVELDKFGSFGDWTPA